MNISSINAIEIITTNINSTNITFSGSLIEDQNVIDTSSGALGGGVSSQWTTSDSDIYYSTGNVGINISSPLFPLSFSNSIGPKISLWNSNSSDNFYGLSVSSHQLNYHVDLTSSDHVFYSGGNNGDGDELMRIQGDGNIGIGTSSPTANLHLTGSFQQEDTVMHFIRTMMPKTGTPQGGTYNGYIILGKAATVSGVNIPSSYVIGKVIMRRGGSDEDNNIDVYDVVSSRGYDNEVFSVNLRHDGTGSNVSQFSRLVKCTYNNVEYHAIETIATGGGPTHEQTFEGYSVDAALVFVDSNYVSNVYDFGTLGYSSELSGRFGIGTFSPSYKLDVDGDINFTGTLYKNGAAFTAGAGSTQWSTSGSTINYNNGNVGIGTSSPVGKLHVSGGAGDCVVIIEADTDNSNESDNPAIWFRQDGGLNEGAIALDHNRLTFINNVSSGGGFAFYTGTTDIGGSSSPLTDTTEKMTIVPNGNVGISTSSPSYKLDVVGDINFTGTLYKNGAAFTAGAGGTQWGTTGSDITYNNGNVGIGITTPLQKLHVNGALYLSANPSNPGNTISASFWNQANVGPTICGREFSVQTNGTTERLRILSNGNVGINTASPLSGSNLLGLHINQGNHAAIVLGDPINSTYGGFIQASDNRHRVFIGANIYDDPTNSWKSNTVNKGYAGISVLAAADEVGWGSTIQFWASETSYTNGASLQVRMSINGDGNVGIGTTSPASKLTIVPTGTQAGLRVSGEAGTSYPQVKFENSTFGLSVETNNTSSSYYALNIANSSKTLMRIRNDGYVGIGTSSPNRQLVVSDNASCYIKAHNTTNNNTIMIGADSTQARLYARKNDQTTPIAFSVYQGSLGDTFVLDTSGNVGIGTSSPAAKLDIGGSFTNGRSLQLRSGDTSDSTDSAQIIFSYNNSSYDNVGYAHSMRTRHNATGTSGNAIDFWLWDHSVDTSSTLGSLRVMTLDGTGNVGIGTSSPSSKLHVFSSASGEPLGYFQSNGDASIRLNGQGGEAYIEYMNQHTTTSNAWKSGINDTTSYEISYGTQGSANSTLYAMSINTSGNVGIGTTSPSYKLHVAGDINFTGTLYQNGSAFSGGGGSSQWTTSGSNITFSSGNVGIYGSSVQSPSSKLEIWDNNSGGDWRMIRLYGGSDGTGDRAGIAMGSFGANEKTLATAIFFEQQNVWPGRTGDLIFATKPYNYPNTTDSVHPTNNERMRITWNGYTGIGTNAPKAKLHVNGTGDSGTSLASASRKYFIGTQSGTSLAYDTSTSNFGTISIYANQEIVTSSWFISHGTTTYSDARIKKDIVDIDDDSALQTIRLLKPKKYSYVDTVSKGSEPVWGFIAQEVKSTLDYAVNLMEKAIPNIMCIAHYDLENNTIVLENFDTANLLRKEDGSLCSVLNLKTWDNREIEISIESIVNASTLKIKTPLKYEDVNGVLYSGKVPTTEQEAIAYEENKTVITNTIFVYGQTVSDFHVLKKDAIFTVAVAALQEIDRRQVQDDERILELESQTASLLEKLESQNNSLLQRIAALEATVLNQ